jgi:hypothetical protein
MYPIWSANENLAVTIYLDIVLESSHLWAGEQDMEG